MVQVILALLQVFSLSDQIIINKNDSGHQFQENRIAGSKDINSITDWEQDRSRAGFLTRPVICF